MAAMQHSGRFGYRNRIPRMTLIGAALAVMMFFAPGRVLAINVCGDGICQGTGIPPETPQNCQADCGTTPPLPPVPGDYDGDRIVDSYENELLQKFAPRIWLHYNENSWPVNVSWLLARSRMRFGHARCPDHSILAYGRVTNANITQQSHRSAHDLVHIPPWDACQHFGDAHRSNGYQGGIKTSFFLQFTDASHTGSTNYRDWVVYGHVYPTSGNRIVIQYWQLYAYDDSFATINHEGDWEYSAVVIDRNERPQRVVYFRHGHSRDVAASTAEWIGNHHVTYSAKGSHAQYRSFVRYDDCVSDSFPDQAQGIADHCGTGTAWDSWTSLFGGIVNVGEKAHPLNGSNWLRYSGLWGEIGAAADVIDYTSGPRGPAYQPAWTWHP